MLNIKFDDLLKAVDSLSPEQKRLLREHIDGETEPAEVDLTKPRILGLHPGAIWTSDDFDDPLPDEFWLGVATSIQPILTPCQPHD
ncbi:MAG: DUF2281 domain-containing protein [Anaerolineaceae bacterium]|nr:DUF2281 domain-containing protein [Anaerolineaceae bacterium]